MSQASLRRSWSSTEKMAPCDSDLAEPLLKAELSVGREPSLPLDALDLPRRFQSAPDVRMGGASRFLGGATRDLASTFAPNEATTEAFGQLSARVAAACGQPLVDQIVGDNSHAVFDCTFEHAVRLYETVCYEMLDQAKDAHQTAATAFENAAVSPPARPFQEEVRGGWEMDVENDEEGFLPAVMDIEAFRRALEHEGFQGLDWDPGFDQLWAELGRDKIDAHAFHYVLRQLKLRLICMCRGATMSKDMESAIPEETGSVAVLDWNARSIHEQYFKKAKEPMDVFLKHRHPYMKMRWLHCASVNKITILRLAAKYQLHPLPVEDTIKLQNQSVPFVRRYGNNFFLQIPLIRLTAESGSDVSRINSELDSVSPENEGKTASFTRVDSEKDWAASAPANGGPHPVQVEQSRLAIFVAGPPAYDTVISVQTGWRRKEDNASATLAPKLGDDVQKLDSTRPSIGTTLRRRTTMWGRRVSGGTNSPKLEGVSNRMASAENMEALGTEAFDRVAQEVLKDFSILRAGNAPWLLWRLLDVCVDDLMPILTAYRLRLQWFSNYIARRKAAASLDVEKQLLRSKVELDWLQRKVRPLQKVVKHLVKEESIEADVTRYIEDVEDHLETFLEEVSRSMGMCDSLREQVRSHRDRQQQGVLYVLTIVTTLFTPMQLLTGVYGMNFQDDAGTPVVPGFGPLTKDRGWYLFWALGLSIILFLLVVFRFYLKWI